MSEWHDLSVAHDVIRRIAHGAVLALLACLSVVGCTTDRAECIGKHMDAVFGVAFSSDGQRVASVAVDGTVAIWDAAKVRVAELGALSQSVVPGVAGTQGHEVVFDDAGTRLWIVAFAHFHVLVKQDVSSANTEIVQNIGRDSTVGVSGSGGALVALCGLGERNGLRATIVGSHLMQQRKLSLVVAPWDVVAVNCDGQGERLVLGYRDGAVGLLTNDVERLHCTLHTGPMMVGCSDDGRWFGACAVDEWAVWRATDGHEMLYCNSGEVKVTRVLFHPTRPLVVLVLANGAVQVLDITTGSVRHELPSIGSAINAASLSRDGRALAVGAVDGRVCVWRFH